MTFLLAASQQTIGLAVVLFLIAGWAVYLFGTARRTNVPGVELEEAPNRKPYFPDEVLETSRLTKYLWWAFATLTVSAVGLPAYWLREPFRQQGAGFDRGEKYFEEKEVERGRELFQVAPGDPPKPREPHFGCEACHGVEGIGGVTSYTIVDPANPDAPPRQVQWTAPALNTVMLRYRPEEVHKILVYGRAGTPMPPWGIDGGGPMNDQQINDLISYLEHLALDAKKVQADSLAKYGTDGQKIFEGYCARCHTAGASYGEPGVPGGGAFGPALTGGATLRQFPTLEQHEEWVAKTGKYGELYGQRGVSEGVMPFFEQELTPEQIKAVVEYERTL
ncbi:MAG: c-type cytochrome [Acidimicrobiales bacterium]